jgi:hypothetical protein
MELDSSHQHNTESSHSNVGIEKWIVKVKIEVDRNAIAAKTFIFDQNDTVEAAMKIIAKKLELDTESVAKEYQLVVVSPQGPDNQSIWTMQAERIIKEYGVLDNVIFQIMSLF